MNKQTSFQCMSVLLGLLLCMAPAQARDAVLTIQGHVSAPSCNAQALSTAMATGLGALNGHHCGLTVSTGQANSLTVANVREVHVGSGPNADAVKKMVILTYH